MAYGLGHTRESRCLEDFSGAKSLYDQIQSPGFGSTINRRPGAPDVGYLKVLSNVIEGYEVTEETPVMIPAMVTLVWRPEAGPIDNPGKWLVHQFGATAEPDELSHVRTSPGDAPNF